MAPQDDIMRILSGCARVLLTGPVGPDGDSLGACLALARLLRARGIDAEVTGEPAPRYQFLPGVAQMTTDEALRDHYDAVVVMDGDCQRLPPGARARFEAAAVTCLVDHHASTDPSLYTVAWLNVTAESTCGMVFRALPSWRAELDAEMATLLYAGLVFDTGNFRHPNTTAETLRMAAQLVETGIDHAEIVSRILHLRSREGLATIGQVLAGVRYFGPLAVASVPQTLQPYDIGDFEGVIDTLVNTEGTTVGALLFERAGGVKISLRSRSDTVDVAQCARELHPLGGGHPRAAGVFVPVPLAQATSELCRVIAAAVAPAHPGRSSATSLPTCDHHRKGEP